MKTARMTAFAIVVLMLLSITASLSSLITDDETTSPELADLPIEMEATSPGYPVFAEYMGAYWCGPCVTASNNLDALYGTNGGGGTQAEDFTFISFWESSSTGWPADSPINRRSHITNAPGYTGGIPVVVFGDADQGTYYTVGGQSYDSFYQNGGDTKDGTDYSLAVIQSENGNMMDIDITATYMGAGSKTVSLYAAVTEEVSPESYSAGSQHHPHHVWKKWLLNSGGSAFESLTLSSGTSITKSWSVPISTVRAGGGATAADNFLTVATLMDGDHTTHRNIVSAADSNMAPVIDVGIQSFTADNSAALIGGYINGDIIDVEATIINNGVDAYTDGGDVRFYYREGNTKHYVGSTHTLANFASNGDTQPFSGQIDTTGLPAAAYQTSFGVELSNLVSDRAASNNDVFEIVPHDLVPVARKAEVIGSNNIERGNSFLVEAKAGINDGVDINLATMTFEIEVSPTGVNQWNGDIVSGGDEIFNEGTSNEHRQYLVQPTMNMGAGDYDLRSRAIDSRGQMSSWEITEDSFALLNALPIITAEPVPTVKVETTTRVSIIANVADAETDLSDLVITSSSPNFIAWHASSEEVEVYFENIRYVGGEPVASGIEVSVDDGTDVAHGTLLFNVIENGQPRWAGVEKQYVDEASSDILDLIQYLSDTDSNGNVVTSQDLVLAIVDNTNPEIINVELSGSYLEYETTDDDVNGMTTVTVRASDGIQFSDQQIAIQISPINDAPRLDLSEFEGLRLKAGTQQVIFVDGLLTDVDSDVNEAFVTVTNAVPGAARYNIMDNTITLQWDQAGMQTVTIQSADRYDSNIYTLVVDVYDSAPLLVGEGPDADVRVSVIDLYIEETPAATLFLNKDDVTITSLTSTWQLCNELTGVCTLQVVHEHDITAKSLGWTFDPFLGQVADGMRMKDQVKLTKIVALDNEGNKYEFKDAKYWTITEEAPGPETMDDETLAEYIVELEDAIDSKEDYLATLTEGTTEHTEAKEDLVELRTDLDEACEFGECISDAPASNTVDPSSSIDLNLTVILIVVSVVVLAALAALLFMRGGRKTEANDFMVDWANQLPSNDAVANSMYGGAGEIFQQPVATPPAPAPVAPQVPAGALPLPEGGLPVGWTMEQWVHYGHQYQQ